MEILNMIDDHSRLLVASDARATTKAADVVASFREAAARHGFPASVLTDNGAVFTAAPRGGGRCAIDRRTYGRVENERRRAKRVLRALHEFQQGLSTPEVLVDVGANVSLQMLGDPQHHVRSQNEDEELLDRAEYLSSLVGGRLMIFTRDKSMEVRARLRGLT